MYYHQKVRQQKVRATNWRRQNQADTKMKYPDRYSYERWKMLPRNPKPYRKSEILFPEAKESIKR